MTGERDELDALAAVLRPHQHAIYCIPEGHIPNGGYPAHLADLVLASDWLAARDEQIRREAVEAVAREWQYGGWTILTAPPPAGGIPSLALGQRVTDWLREKTEQIGGE